MNTIGRFLGLILIELVGFTGGFSKPTNVHKGRPFVVQPRPRFRYAIVESGLLHNGRLLFVLIDAEAYSEQNLRELFQLVSKRFPQPTELWITVCTNLRQIPTPEEIDYLSAHPDDNSIIESLDVAKYPSAEYARSKQAEYFEYSPGAGQPKKTIIIAGKDPTSPK